MLLGVENIDVNLKAGGGRSPLHMIAEKNPRYMEEGHLRAMSSLLRAHGININLKYKDGNTPLSRACVRANLEAVRVLLRAGADANIQNDFGSTALGIAKSRGKREADAEATAVAEPEADAEAYRGYYGGYLGGYYGGYRGYGGYYRGKREADAEAYRGYGGYLGGYYGGYRGYGGYYRG